SLQAGAAFQAREDEKWRNRILWCDLDVDECVLRAEPLMWSRATQDWVLDTEAFGEEYRKGARWHLPVPWLKPCAATRDLLWAPPPGWDAIDNDFLAQRLKLTEEDLLAYFDGSIPT